MAGRTSDVSLHKLENLTARRMPSTLDVFWVLWHRVHRFKTTTESDHPLVPHRHQMLLCYLFSLAYTFVVNDIDISESGHVFPSFATKLFNPTSQVESRVSTHFNTTIDLYWTVMHEHFSTVPPDDIPLHFSESMQRTTVDAKGKIHSLLRSHANRRKGISDLQENHSPHTFVRRVGLIAQNIHTMFEYFFNLDKQDMACAHTLAGWYTTVNGAIQGGIAPNFDSIKTSPKKLAPFTKALFHK